MQDKPIPDGGDEPAGHERPGTVRVLVSPIVLETLRENADSILMTLQTGLEEATVRPPSGTPEPADEVAARRARIAEQEELLAQLRDVAPVELVGSAGALCELVYLALGDVAENVAVDAIYAWQDDVPLDAVRRGVGQLAELVALADALSGARDRVTEGC